MRRFDFRFWDTDDTDSAKHGLTRILKKTAKSCVGTSASSAFQKIVILLIISQLAPAQEPVRPTIDVNAFVQNLIPPVQNDDLNYNDLFENLLQLYSSPLDLNTCTQDELSGLYILSERQISNFFDHRNKYGKLLSLYELQAITDFDLATIQKLLPFVIVGSNTQSLWNTLNNASENYLIIRTENLFEQKRGFTDNAPKSGGVVQKYQGSPTQWYSRYRYRRSNSFSLGFTMEKDEGERFEWSPATRKYGTDYFSYHFQIQNRGVLKNLILGDYQLQVGQGLIFSAGFFVGKGAETVLTVKRPAFMTKPYTSVTEGGFFRGATATVALSKNVFLTAMASRAFRDGTRNIEDDGSATISSILTSGLRRTPNEMLKRGNLLEQNIGGHLLYKADKGQFGLTMLNTVYNTKIQRADALYNKYEFSGTNNLLLGIHGNYQSKSRQVFGELARSSSGGLAVNGGLIMSLSKRWDAAVLLRHYDKNYHSFFSNAFGENTRNNNETGLYIGAKYVIHKKLTAGAYIDSYRFAWFKYLLDKQPTNGYDYLLQTTWTPNKKLSFYAVFRDEYKDKNVPSRLSKAKIIAETARRNLILSSEYQISKVLSWRMRVQGGTYTYAGFAPSRGWMAFEEINADWGKFSINARLCAYNTDDYDSRQYAIERDVLYAVSWPAYYERGFRNYVVMQWSPARKIDFWLRYSRTDLPDRTSIGSSGDEIYANHRSEIKLQLRYKFL